MTDLAKPTDRARRRWPVVAALALAAVVLLGLPLAPRAKALDENPPAAFGCGLDIALVVDRHTSNQATGWPGLGSLRDQAKTFVSSLEGSGATVSVTSFAGTASVAADATEVDASGNAALQAALDGVAVTNGALAGSSNWEAALLTARSTFSGFSGGHPDLLIVISDSAANADNGAGTPVPSAEAAADSIKNAGVHTYAVMVQGTAIPFPWIGNPPAAPIFGPRAEALPTGDYFNRRLGLVAEWLTMNVDHLCDGPTDSGAANPTPALNACPADIAVVLDRRVSPQATGWTTADALRDQVAAFIRGIEGTGSRVSITSFAETASVVAPPTLVDPVGSLLLQTSLDLIPVSDGPVEGTSNWEDALLKGRSTFAEFPDDRPDLLLLITDTAPNLDNGADDPVASAREAADGIKEAGTHIFGLMPIGSSGIEVPPSWLIESPMVPVTGSNRGLSYLDDWELLIPNRISSSMIGLLRNLCLPVADNVDLEPAAVCSSLDVAFVIDRSGSIGPTNLRLLKAGLKRVLDEVADTGSRVSITSYSTAAAVNAEATEVTTGAGLDALRAAVDGLVSQGDTNWYGGLTTARTTFAGFMPAGRPDLVVHITDGEPNVGATFPEAIEAANSVKRTGAHMLGVAIGPDITAGNVLLASGPDRLPHTPFGEADLAIVKRFSQLGDVLVDGLGQLCDASVTVRKLVGDAPAADWSFTATNATPERGVTDDDGSVTFTYDFDFGGGSVETRIRELDKDGYELLGASCLDAEDDLVGDEIADGIELPIAGAARITCTFQNAEITASQPGSTPGAPSPTTAAPGGGAGPGGTGGVAPGEQELPKTGLPGGTPALLGALSLALALALARLVRSDTTEHRGSG